jgi:hypothetical protein
LLRYQLDSYVVMEQTIMQVSLNNTVGAAPITPVSSTQAVDKPTSALALRVELAEQGRPEDARVAHEVRNEALLEAANKPLDPAREIWDAPAPVLDVLAQYAGMDQLGALHDLGPGFARTLKTTPHRAALASPQRLQDIKALEDERRPLLLLFPLQDEQPAHLAKVKALTEQIDQARDVVAVAERRRIGQPAATLDEERSARDGLATAAQHIFREVESLAHLPAGVEAPGTSTVHQAAANFTKILDGIQPHLETLASRPDTTDVYREFLRIGLGQIPDSSVPQMEVLSAGFDKLMLSPGYDQLKDELKEFCRWMNTTLKFHLDPDPGI